MGSGLDWIKLTKQIMASGLGSPNLKFLLVLNHTGLRLALPVAVCVKPVTGDVVGFCTGPDFVIIFYLRHTQHGTGYT